VIPFEGPPDLPLEIAVLQENFGNAVHTAFAVDLRAKKILVTGCGPVGLMTIIVARAIGARAIYATDISPYRIEFARRVGADLALHATEDQVIDLILEATDGEGVDVLLEAFRQIRDQRPQVRCLIVGDGRSRSQLIAQAERLELESTVQFLGFREKIEQLEERLNRRGEQQDARAVRLDETEERLDTREAELRSRDEALMARQAEVDDQLHSIAQLSREQAAEMVLERVDRELEREKAVRVRSALERADAEAKRLIRGVGSGFSVVKETLAGLDGVLEIEDNLGQGTVVTARVSPLTEASLASAGLPSYNLSERQLKILLLTVELAPVGPTRLAQELGVSTSTAYRDLVSLEQAGFVACETSGQRSVTESGLVYLDTVL